MFGTSLLRVCRRLCTSTESQSTVLLQRLHDNEKLRDYQYCQVIERELKRDAVLPAMNAFLRSHLHSVVLDAQTYNNIFAKLQQHNFDVSFVEVLYRLYRQHLSPNPLMLKMMEVLVGSLDAYPLVKRDYEYLKIEMPKHSARGRRVVGQLKKIVDEESKQKIKIDELALDTKEEAGSDRLTHLNDSRITDELVKMINPLANCDIKLYDLKLEFFSQEGALMSNAEQDRMQNGMMYDSDTEEEEEGEDEQELSLADMLSNVKSLRIGRIEITHKKED